MPDVITALLSLGCEASISGGDPTSATEYRKRVTIHTGKDPGWTAVRTVLAEMGSDLHRLHKKELWSRLTEGEADRLDRMLQDAPPRLRRMYEAASYLDDRDPDWGEIASRVQAELGESRSDEVLARTH